MLLNVLLVRLIVKHQRVRRESLHIADNSSTRDIDRGAVAMLLACAVSYVITQTPGFIGNVLLALDKGCVLQLHPSVRPVLGPILNVLLNINFSINFLLYCRANPRFRKTVKRLLGMLKGPYDRRKSTSSTRSESLVSKPFGLAVNPQAGLRRLSTRLDARSGRCHSISLSGRVHMG